MGGQQGSGYMPRPGWSQSGSVPVRGGGPMMVPHTQQGYGRSSRPQASPSESLYTPF